LRKRLGDFLKLLYQHHLETFAHSVRVARHCRKLGSYCGLALSELQRLVFAGLSHDIGKISVPVGILDSPEPLDDVGFGEIEKHPWIGSNLIEPILGKKVAELVLAHHEPGYRRKQIRREEVRADLKNLLRLADRFDALRSRRAYKPVLSADECREILLREGFAGELIEVLLTDS
jgi:HD-GYP domain-containing protein (c-di-GMP phosphodiesterase class II)